MALPTNDHHVHSDGYTSDLGDPDLGRMLVELGDELEQLSGVQNVWPDEELIEIEYDGADARERIEDEAREWGCVITAEGDGWCEIRQG